MSTVQEADLTGAIDYHLHASPDLLPRKQEFIDVAREARDARMRAIVLKPTGSFPTIDKAKIAEKLVPGIRVFGGLLLDNVVGGLNPRAVHAAIMMGAKVVWMPLFDSANHIRRGGSIPLYAAFKKGGYTADGTGLTVLTRTGELKPEVEEILNMIAEAKEVVLDTAHLSAEEDLVLIEEAKRRGIEYVVANHPSAKLIGATIEQQKEMAKRGAYLNQVYANCLPYMFELDPRVLIDIIRSVGVEHCILSSDSGHVAFPRPVQCFREFIDTMSALGLTQAEIDTMIRKNPAKVLSLDS